jgi:hypothetical protein
VLPSDTEAERQREGRNSLPLYERARIEVYLPDLPKVLYQDLLEALNQEFTYTFGGCTIIRGLDGSYLSNLGIRMQDRTALVRGPRHWQEGNQTEALLGLDL